MARDPLNTTDWNAVAARAQAFQALYLAGLSEKRVTEKARFLMVLGLSRPEAAALLGSSDDSLRIMFAREAKKESGALSAKSVAESV